MPVKCLVFTTLLLFRQTSAPHRLSHADAPRLVQDLVRTPDKSGDFRIVAAEHLLCIAETHGGPDQVVEAVIHTNTLPQLIGYLSNSSSIPNSESQQVLMQRTISLLAHILSFQHTWEAALRAQVVPLLTARLHESFFNPTLDPQIDAACALANITAAEGGKHMAVQAGTVPLLVDALTSPSGDLVKMAVRTLKNIASIKGGRRAIYAAGAVPRLAALLDLRPPADNQVRYDAVKALTYVASVNKAAREKMRAHGAIEKLKALPNPPEQLELAAEELGDDLDTGGCCLLC